jgi:hypothetical protein
MRWLRDQFAIWWLLRSVSAEMRRERREWDRLHPVDGVNP